MNKLDALIKLFEKFPGVGARQARRFAFHILTLPKDDVTELSELVNSLQSSVRECTSCFRFYSQNGGTSELCPICSNENRDRSKLMVVERDSDIQAIERSGTYDGLYFVLGGTIPLLGSKETKKLRGGALRQILETRSAEGLSEIILAFAVNPDGENTSRYVESLINESRAADVTVSELGRGLSTGSELEYADPETIKNALENRN